MPFVVRSFPKSKQAIYVDSIVSLSDPLSSTSSIASLVSLLTLAYRVQAPPPCQQERLLTLLHTMSPATVDEDAKVEGYSHEEIVNSFIQFLGPVLNGMAGMIDFLSAVDAFSRPESFRDFWSLEGINLIKEFIEGGSPFGVMKGSDVPFLDTFVEDSSCRIALGKEKGMLMLVPGHAEVGDEVFARDGEQQLTASKKGDLTNEDSAIVGGPWKTGLAVSSTMRPASPEGFVSE